MIASRRRLSRFGGGRGVTQAIDALIQGLIDGALDYGVMELYAGSRPAAPTDSINVLTIATDPKKVHMAAHSYRIGSTTYSLAAQDLTLTGPTVPKHPLDTTGNGNYARYYGCWRISVNTSGTITITPGTSNVNGTKVLPDQTVTITGNDTGYQSYSDAYDNLPAVPGGSANVGYMIVSTNGGANGLGTDYVPGTTSLAIYDPFVWYVGAKLMATYTFVPPVAPLAGLVSHSEIAVNAVGGVVYVAGTVDFARLHYYADATIEDLWVGEAGSGADLIFDDTTVAVGEVLTLGGFKADAVLS